MNLLEHPPRTYSEIPSFKGEPDTGLVSQINTKKKLRVVSRIPAHLYDDVTGSSEDDYFNNRLSRDYKTRERRFELPYEKTYNRAATSGYNTGTTCNNKSFGDLQEDECCEGFSTFK